MLGIGLGGALLTALGVGPVVAQTAVPAASTPCPKPQVNCNGVCVNLSNDLQNCGSCGSVCPAPANGTARCVQGACKVTCNAGYTSCSGTCINITSDPNRKDDEEYIVRLIGQVITVSVETVKIVTALPALK